MCDEELARHGTSSMDVSNEARPRLEIEEGWRDISKFSDLLTRNSYVSGEPEGDRIRMRYWQRIGDGAAVGKAWFGPKAQGPPGYAHGGSQAALMDEVMGAAAWIAGHAVFTARLTHHYRQMLPLLETVRFEAIVDRVEGRKVHVKGFIESLDGKTYSETEGLFVMISSDRLSDMATRFVGQSSPR